MTELSTIELINKSSGTKLTLVKGQFSIYDAEDDDYIVEIKNRRKYYSVVTDDKGVYVYNISNHMTQIVNLPMKAIQCPRSTDFNNNDKITKYSYELPETLAIKL